MSYINSPTAASDDLTSGEEAYINSLVAQSYTSGSLLIAGGTGVIPTEFSIGANNTFLTVDSLGNHLYRPIVAGANVSIVYNVDEIQISATEAASGGGTVTSVSVVTANGVSGSVATATTTPAITLTLGAITPSSVTVSGLTASELVATDGSKVLQSLAVATYPSLTELAYVRGVTSAIQTQIGLKANLASPTFSGTVTIPTPFTIGAVSMTATGTELNYVVGVTSAIQTQIDGKAATGQTFYIGTTQVAINRASAALTLAGITLTTPDIGTPSAGVMTNVTGTAASLTAGLATSLTGGSGGTIPYQSAAGTTAMLANGTAGQVLQSNGTTLAPSWVAAGAGDMVLASIQTVTGAKTFGSAGAVGKLKIAGTTSGALTVDTSAVAGTAVITIPAVTDTLVGKATTDTLTNKTFDADGTGNSITNIENADIKAAAAIAVNKLAALTASEIVITDASGFIASAAVGTYPSLTELTYVKGVTSAIQTQLGTKVTSGGALGTPSSGTGTNITGIPAANILAGSFGAGAYVISTSLQAATIELGHATDTTLSRVSAGVIAVEGVNIMTVSSADTITGVKTLGTTGAIKLGSAVMDKCEIRLNNAALNDETWSGTIIDATLGATIAVGDVCYLQTADSRWELVDGILDGTDVGFKLKLGICLVAGDDGSATKILLDGVIASAAFPTFTVGAPVYLSDTAGDLVVAQPSTANFAIRVVGEAVSATVLHFHPSNDYIVHV